MNKPHRATQQRIQAIGFNIVLAVALGLITEIQAQQFTRLPPVGEQRLVQHDDQDLRYRVQHLERTLAAYELGTLTTSDHGVQVATFWQSDTPTVEPIKLANLAETVFHGDGFIDIGRYVKADFIHDFNPIGSTDAFDPVKIPTDGRPGENTRFHARQTRLNLDYRPNSDYDDLRLFIEGDFFGIGNVLRMRHAFVRAGRLLAGQTWSTFMDESILPRTLDFESPRSIILDRRGLVRWTQPISDSLAMAVALEDPQAAFDVISAPAEDVEQAAPDLIGRIRCEQAWGHLQAAGLVRLLRYRQATGAKDDAIGWGLNFTGRVRPHEFDSVLFQFAFGEGMESYRQGSDAAVDAGGNLETTPLVAWVVGYEIDWTDQISSAFVYSAGSITNASFEAPTEGQAAEYLAVNLLFEPLPRLSWGVEYLYGTRTDEAVIWPARCEGHILGNFGFGRTISPQRDAGNNWCQV